jgi:predicted phage-related endonuclease
MEWGKLLEVPIAQKYSKVTGRILEEPQFIYRHEQHEWMLCNPDRLIIGEPRGTGVLEVKTASAFKREEWEDEPPLLYQVQAQHLMVVLGIDWASFAVLIGGQKFAWCDVERNERFCAYLVEKEGEFVDRVRRGDPPPPDASDSTREVLLKLYPKDNKETVELDIPPQVAERRRALKEEEKRVEAELQAIDNKLKAAIGNATIGLLRDGTVFSWKWQHRDGYVVQPTEFRVLRELKGKRR